MNNGVSGLRAEKEALGVIGDNIANVNTAGFKYQRALFEDVFLKSSSGSDVGAGVEQSKLQQAFTQGSLAQTGVATDLGISGGGFFTVSGSVNGVTGVFYSRAGQFRIDPAGGLVDPSGLDLLGYTALPDGTLAASVSPLIVPTSSIPAKATDTIQITANLDAGAPVIGPFDSAQPATTANFSTSIQVFDTLGGAHSADVYFNKVADGQWEYHVVMRGDELDPSTPGANVEVSSGSLTFTTTGALGTASTSPIDVTFAPGGPLSIAIDFGTALADGGTGLAGTTQFGSPSSVSNQLQNGYGAGAFSGVSSGSDGTVEGLYTNGLRLPVGQIALAVFRSENGLARAGNGLWAATPESGQAALSAAGTGGRGMLSAGTLESSNVDLAREFTNMIMHQRSFSADSKVIAAADDMLTVLMQMRR